MTTRTLRDDGQSSGLGMKIAAIYARKSTEQRNVDDEAKSVVRQVENARAFAAAKGWRVLDEYVYSDDAISGAEIKKLRARQRLLDTIWNKPPFQILIMRDTSRFSRRDGDEAFAELKAIARAGVEVWCYGDGQQFTYGDFASNVVGFVRAEMNADYRRQISRWTYEAMVRKARRGEVTGGTTFGYSNVRVGTVTKREINPAEAAVVRRIFHMCASGKGFTRIAIELNQAGAPAPKPRRHGRTPAWDGSTVRSVLRRPDYRGEWVYGRTRWQDPIRGFNGRRDEDRKQRPREQHDWTTVPMPDLRIVSTTSGTPRMGVSTPHGSCISEARMAGSGAGL
jgi:site-specific DNA recombinase